MEKNLISILLVGGEPMMLESLHLLLEARGDMRVLGRTPLGPNAIAIALAQAPDIILVAELGATSVTPFLASLVKENVRIPLVVVSERNGDPWRDDMQLTGVDATIWRSQTLTDAVITIHDVVQRAKDPESRRATAAPLRRCARDERPDDEPHFKALTRRQRQVLGRTAAGESLKEIASALGVAAKTVEAHRATGMARLRITSRTDLVRYAVGQNWLDAL